MKFLITLFLILFGISVFGQSSMPITVKAADLDQLEWSTSVASKINSNHYEYYALFSALNCIFPTTPPSRINDIIADFEKEFQKKVDHDPLLRFRESDALNAGLTILGLFPEFKLNASFAKKAYKYLGIYNSVDQQYSDALYGAQSSFNMQMLAELGKAECTELYRQTRQYPQAAVDAYNTFFKNNFDFDVDFTGTQIIKIDSHLLNPITQFIVQHTEKNGDVIFSPQTLDSLNNAFLSSFNLVFDNSVKTNYSLLNNDTSISVGSSALSGDEINKERSDAQALFAGLNLLSKVFEVAGENKTAKDVAFLALEGAKLYNIISQANEAALNNTATNATAMLVSFNYLAVIMDVVMYFKKSEEINFNQIILQEFQRVEKDIKQLYDYNKERFDQIDSQLKNIFLVMNGYFDRIIVNLQVLNSGIDEIKTGISGIQQNMIHFYDQINSSTVQTEYGQFNTLLEDSKRSNYSNDYVIPQSDFVKYQDQFEFFAKTIASSNAFSISDPNSIVDNGIDRNLNILQATLIDLICDTTKKCLITNKFLSNPTMLMNAANGFMDLANDWPEFKGNVKIAKLKSIESQCNDIMTFIKELNGNGNIDDYKTICDALIINYKKKVNNLLVFWDQKEKDYLNANVCNRSTTRSRCISFKPYNSIDQGVDDLQISDIAFPNDLQVGYPSNSQQCKSPNFPDTIVRKVLNSIPNFLKIADFLNIGTLEDLATEGLYVTNVKYNPTGNKFDITSNWETDISIYLRSSSLADGKQGFTYVLGKVTADKEIDFGLTMTNVGDPNPLLSAFEPNKKCSILNDLFITPQTLSFIKYPSGQGLSNYYRRFIEYNKNSPIAKQFFKQVLNYSSKQIDSIDQDGYLKNIIPIRKKLADTLSIISNNMASYMLSENIQKSSEFLNLKNDLERSRNLLLGFIALTLPVSNAYDDTLRISLTSSKLLTTNLLTTQYIKQISTAHDNLNIVDYFDNIINSTCRDLKERVIYLFTRENASAMEISNLDLNKELSKISLFYKYN
ncbi:hypothetical protein [Mucilaginibacter paludis]|uniref:Uncharacterized protein n=1 Tax=Mucilaginibacter paludis DSM 18603 TaxID=714943 RepID=H1YAF4_9SPHI|nr:hypothetical protein [Mucilaginibacter paludis]EHQ26997.1 hypothetical protein Mucpa_2888 [Mucilaginibacter paludis DSM 18603]